MRAAKAEIEGDGHERGAPLALMPSLILALLAAGCGPIAAGIVVGTQSSSSSPTPPPQTPPTASVTTPARSTTGTAAIAYAAFDNESHPVDLTVTYSVVDLSTGSRLTGAGFGGCTLHLVDPEAVGEIVPALERSFEARYARRPPVWLARVGPGAEGFDPPA